MNTCCEKCIARCRCPEPKQHAHADKCINPKCSCHGHYQEPKDESLRNFLTKGGLKAAEEALSYQSPKSGEPLSKERLNCGACGNSLHSSNCKNEGGESKIGKTDFLNKAEKGGWHERFNKQFGEYTHYVDGVRYFIGRLSTIEMRMFIEQELKAVEKRVRREVAHLRAENKRTEKWSDDYYHALDDVLSRLNGNEGEQN